MEDRLYKFSEINHTEDLNFDNSLNDFYALGVEGTIRENIQNSLDAKLPGVEEPVEVNIELSYVNKTDIPGVKELFDRIRSLEGKNEYSKATISEIKRYESLNKIPVLTIEDSNTTGLSGAKNGKSGNSKDTFGVYAYEKGSHATSLDSKAEAVRGGSHGVGKIANNAASQIFLSFFANCDEKGEKHVGGTIHLIDHELNGIAYRKTGYFTDEVTINGKNKFIPYENKNLPAIFDKEIRGLKNIIPYIREDFLDKSAIIRAVIDNFFVAVLEEKIVVTIKDNGDRTIIDKESIKFLIKDNEIYEIQEVSEMKKTLLYYM